MNLGKMLLMMSVILLLLTGISTAAQRMVVMEFYTNVG